MTKILRSIATCTALLLSVGGNAACPSHFAAGDTNYIARLNQLIDCVVAGGSVLTTKGDVLGYSTAVARIPVGTNGQVLTADSAQALGLKWATPASSGLTATYIGYGDGSNALTGTADLTYDTSVGQLWITKNAAVAAGVQVYNADNGGGTYSFMQVKNDGNSLLQMGKASSGWSPANQGWLINSTGSLLFQNNAAADMIFNINSAEAFRVVSGGHIKAEGVTSTGATGTGKLVFDTSPTIATPSIAKLANLTSNGLVTTSGGDGTLSVTATTGSGNAVLATSPALTTPNLGTPSAVTLTNGSGLPSSGVLTMGASAFNSAAQSINNTTETAVTFDSETSPNFDTDAIHSTSSNTSRFTVPTGGAGKWSGVCGGAFAAATNGARAVYWKLNGNLVHGSYAQSGGHASVPMVLQAHLKPLILADGDYVECWVYQSSGGNLNFGGASVDYMGAASVWRIGN